jgi:hypothetical protein
MIEERFHRHLATTAIDYAIEELEAARNNLASYEDKPGRGGLALTQLRRARGFIHSGIEVLERKRLGPSLAEDVIMSGGVPKLEVTAETMAEFNRLVKSGGNDGHQEDR